MSLTTSCPACGTMFRVVPDQLKISEGWVRCGHCAEVFDGTAHLSEGAAVAVTPSPAMSIAPQYVERDAGPDSEELGPTSVDAPFVLRRSDLVDEEPAPAVTPPAPTRTDSGFESEEVKQAPPDLEEISFVRQARRKALWRRPLVRITLAFASLLLAGALLLQVAYQDRDKLAVAQPPLRPLLERMCAYLHCTLEPPRQIDAIVIESSGFSRLRNDAYRLSFTLRNTAPISIAAPAMELTLTDNQDQPVLRRVLSPAELGAREAVLAAGAEWTSAVGVVLNSNGGARIAGYRLLAFYP